MPTLPLCYVATVFGSIALRELDRLLFDGVLELTLKICFWHFHIKDKTENKLYFKMMNGGQKGQALMFTGGIIQQRLQGYVIDSSKSNLPFAVVQF
jgi:hypothetical protein